MEPVNSVELFRMLLKKCYQEWIEEELVEVLKNDDNGIVLKEKETEIRVVIDRENLIPADNRAKEGWETYWLERYLRDYNYELNSKIKYFKDKGFYTGNYAEFLFSYTQIEDVLSETVMQNFKIDDVEFEIGSPSNIFKLIFNHISTDSHFEWANFYTIKLRNVNKEMLEDYLQNAMYILHKYCPSDLSNDYPEVYQYSYFHEYWVETEIVDESNLDTNFKSGKYPEALALYNEGKRKRDFLNFYRVLEYFFLINRKDEFKSFILDYNQNKDIDKVLEKITDVYKLREDILLGSLLNKTNNIGSIMDKALSKGLISNNTDKEELANKLYAYRNSRVHGKRDAKMDLLIPTILDSNNKEWELIIENIADLVIKQFCYS
ncbi:hypothetical protein [Bacillus sp. BS98]|uniref:hypothetical protein n=1 Tax=Bacillus sp. BS98 TaxID=2608254 RepID=UPI00122F2593|nr:hypothetical protein [Bacillus sp. BS98]QEQ20774.1 hypothetical protein F0362_30015 [Bacillus sp. BS98]